VVVVDLTVFGNDQNGKGGHSSARRHVCRDRCSPTRNRRVS
jgi:hypothetical protein